MMPIGSFATAPSVTRKQMCSGVWPGVCITSSRMLPTVMMSPSFTSRAPSDCAKAYCQSLPPSAERSSWAPLASDSVSSPPAIAQVATDGR